MKGRKAQIEMNFSIIFSIILIIIFLVVGFYAITQFLGIKNCSQEGIFKSDLQQEISKAWSSDESVSEFTGDVPPGIQGICFIDLSKNQKGEYKEEFEKARKRGYVNLNMFYYPVEEACENGFEIEHINIEKITDTKNPYCIEKINGKITVKLEKNFQDSLVYLS